MPGFEAPTSQPVAQSLYWPDYPAVAGCTRFVVRAGKDSPSEQRPQPDRLCQPLKTGQCEALFELLLSLTESRRAALLTRTFQVFSTGIKLQPLPSKASDSYGLCRVQSTISLLCLQKPLIFCGATAQLGHGLMRFLDHTKLHAHSVGLLWMIDQLVAETAT
jgi:hypothetical protein